jgi:exodeoxyribonuclease VIII
MTTHKKITDSEYNALTGLRASVLKELVKSPLHAKYAEDNIKDNTPALLLGRWLHSYILEPDNFAKKHHFLDEKLDLRKSADKERKALLVQEFGENIIDLQTAEVLKNIRKSAYINQSITNTLKAVSEVELSLQWQERGLECKARLDAYSEQLGAIIDIKTCQDASKSGFSRTINNFNYHLQAAHYLAGAAENGIKADKFIFIAFEKNAPYASAIYLLDIGTIGTAQTQREFLLELYKKCKQRGLWPSYSNKVENIALPEWASAQIENEFLEDKNYE